MELNIAVRKIVEYVMLSGDLELDRFVSSSRAMAGIAVHKKIQKDRGDDYSSEVFVSHTFDRDGINLKVSGRIDGIYHDDGKTVIEEIKSTTETINRLKLKKNKHHWAQAKFYGYLYAFEHDLSEVNIVVVYCNIDDGKILELKESYSFEFLEKFVNEVVDKYLVWAKKQLDWFEIRNRSLNELEFPHKTYRKGQRGMAVSIYRTLRDGGELLIQAPTGIGKTVASVFPALKILPETENSKIFYLTARGTGKVVAEKAIQLVNSRGGRCKMITLTAKEKICFNPGAACNARECRFAKGYYDRVNDALSDIYSHDIFDRDLIETYALKHLVCPFEFSLYLSLWCDFIICDYNYAFDPRVKLKRYFAEGGEAAGQDFYFLVDEAHNLVDRSRSMFSASLNKDDVLKLRRLIKSSQPEMYKHLSAMNKWFLKQRKMAEESDDFLSSKEQPEELYPILRRFKRRADTWLALNFATDYRRTLLDFYFLVVSFLRISENFGEDYLTCYTKEGKDLQVKLFCLDPARSLRTSNEPVKSVVYFSATLSPLSYYREIFGWGIKAGLIDLPSPFPRENLLLARSPVSTRYKDRNETLDQLIVQIKEFIHHKIGNFLIFFPSYRYMKQVYEMLDCDDVELVMQESNMSDDEREAFVQLFKEKHEKPFAAFAVMGGIFGEGIDLRGEHLEGAVIVGVGLPGIDDERDLIKDYFSKRNKGFEFAYLYPGLTRVMQAAGRVIRSETDKGAVLLIDDRFSSYQYSKNLPQHWAMDTVKDVEDLKKNLTEFWRSDPTEQKK